MRSNSAVGHFPLSRVGIVTILLLACWLTGIGMRQRWRESEVRDVAEQFTTALLDADLKAAQQHLDPLLQDLTTRQFGRHNTPDWATESNTKVQIAKCEITQNIARVELKIEKLGFAIRPRLTLQEFPELGWKITDISNITVDDRWVQFTRWQQRQKEEQLAEQIARALGNRANIDIRRIAREESPTAANQLR